jgi:hypothetical protein
VPAHTYGSHAYFWNIVTYSFVETNMLLFATDAAFIFTFFPIFERMWGATETACFFLACVASAALLLLVSLIACFAVTMEWKVLQVCSDVAAACFGSYIHRAVRQRRTVLCRLRCSRFHRSDLPQRPRPRHNRQKCALGLCRCFAPHAFTSFFAFTHAAAICCILRVISGGVFEALLVVYGGVSGSLSLRSALCLKPFAHRPQATQ